MDRPETAPSPGELGHLLRSHGVSPTRQRMQIAAALFEHAEHVSADDLFERVNAADNHVSKATVYNTLALFVERGLIRAVIADPERTYYDPNTRPHHHFFDAETGRLIDIDGSHVNVSGLPDLPPGTELDGVDVIVRLRRAGR